MELVGHSCYDHISAHRRFVTYCFDYVPKVYPFVCSRQELESWKRRTAARSSGCTDRHIIFEWVEHEQ
jgi:hypothetical protein